MSNDTLKSTRHRNNKSINLNRLPVFPDKTRLLYNSILITIDMIYRHYMFYHVDIQTVHVLPCWYTDGTCFTMLIYRRYMFYHVDIQTVHVLPCWYTDGTCFTMLIYRRYMFYHLDIQTVHVLPCWMQIIECKLLIWYTDGTCFTMLNADHRV
jgi:hypothetical protein